MTDVRDHASLQAAIDHAIGQNGIVHIPAGMEIDHYGTLRLGKADGTLSSVSLVSEQAGNYRGHVGKGAIIRFHASDKPAIAVVGQRDCTISNIALIGPNRDYVQSNGLGSTTPAFNDTDAADWWNPALNPAGMGQYNPCAGIAVDPYEAGNASSNVFLDRVHIAGFAAGVATQPCNRDGNGDFLSMRDSRIEHCVYGWSIGQTQARLSNLDNTKINNVHTAFTGTVHGKQSGSFSGVVSGCEISNLIRLADMSTARGFGLTFTGCHGEAIWTLGSFGGNNSTNRDVVFTSCVLKLSGHPFLRGIPALLTEGDQHRIRLHFIGGTLQLPTIMASDHQIRAEGLQVMNMDGEAASSPSAARKRLHNWSAGYVRTAPYMVGDNGGDIKRVAVWKDDGTTTNDWHRTSMGKNAANVVKPRFGAVDLVPYATPAQSGVWAKNAGDTWTGNAGQIVLPAGINAMKPGDLLLCGLTGMACLVNDATGNQAGVTALNNVRDGGFIRSIDGNNWWWFST